MHTCTHASHSRIHVNPIARACLCTRIVFAHTCIVYTSHALNNELTHRTCTCMYILFVSQISRVHVHSCRRFLVYMYTRSHTHTHPTSHAHTYMHIKSARMHTCGNATHRKRIHTSIQHACIHPFIHPCVRACTHTCIHTCTHTCRYTCRHTCTHTCTYTCTHTSTQVLTCIHACTLPNIVCMMM